MVKICSRPRRPGEDRYLLFEGPVSQVLIITETCTIFTNS